MTGTSTAGERWRAYYQSGSLSWFSPDHATYAYITRFAHSEWIQRILKHTRLSVMPGVRVLEAGCGTGIYALSLATLGYVVDAFDYNAEAVRLAAGLARSLQACARYSVSFYQDNLLSIGQPDESFDLVFNQAVFEYFEDPTERAKALAEMVRVTKPGGHVALIVQHTAHPLRHFWERAGWEGYRQQPPVRRITPDLLAQELADAGLADVVIDGIEPWKALFFYPRWYARWGITHQLVYLCGRALRFVPLPQGLCAKMAIQILGVGRKP